MLQVELPSRGINQSAKALLKLVDHILRNSGKHIIINGGGKYQEHYT